MLREGFQCGAEKVMGTLGEWERSPLEGNFGSPRMDLGGEDTSSRGAWRQGMGLEGRELAKAMHRGTFRGGVWSTWGPCERSHPIKTGVLCLEDLQSCHGGH